MTRIGRSFAVVLAATSLTTASCKPDPVQEYAKVRRACRMGDRRLAHEITDELRKKDEHFKILFDKAVAEVGGARDLDYCNPMLLLAVENRLNEPKK